MDHLLKAAARYPLLTALEEVELGRLIRAWQDHPDGPEQAPSKVQKAGKRALDRFVVSNIRLAYHYAKRYSDRGVPIEDLTQAAIEGLINAYKKYKPDLGYRSSSYAVWYAKQACQQLVAAMGQTLRLPVHTCDALARVARVVEQHTETHGTPPSAEQVAEGAKLTVEGLRQLQHLAARARMMSLDAGLLGIGDDETAGTGRAALASAVASPVRWESELFAAECAKTIRQVAIETPELSPQQRFIITQRYLSEGSPSLVRLAQLLHMNRETTARLEEAALAALRPALAQNARDYLELLAA